MNCSLDYNSFDAIGIFNPSVVSICSYFKLQLMVGVLSFCWDEDVHKAFQAVFAHTGQFSNYPVFTKFKLTHFKWLLCFSLMYEKKSYGKREFHEMGGGGGSLPKTIKGLVNSILPLGEVESNNEWWQKWKIIF